jgi:hypothetical protein
VTERPADEAADGPAAQASDRLSDDELWRGVEATVRDVLLPALTDDWARAAAVQLVGVVRYARRRPADDLDARVAELRATLHALAHNPLAIAHQPPVDSGAGDVLAAAGHVLAAAVEDDGPAGDEVRALLRPVLLRHLDEELAVTAPLVAAFRGRLDE